MSEPVYTVQEASTICVVSIKTIQRKIPLLEGFGAKKVNGSWSIPLSALIASGLNPGRTTNKDTQAMSKESVPINELRIVQMESQLSSAKTELELWKKLAEERLERLNDMKKMLLPAVPTVSQPVQVVAETISKPRKKWWSR